MKSRSANWNGCRAICCALILASLPAVPSVISGHEVRRAYLQLHQTGAETYGVFWKVPGRGDNMRLSLYVEMPKNCSDATQHRATFGDNTVIEQWSVRCGGGLTGSSIQVAGLEATMTDVLVRLERLDDTQVTRLTRPATSFTVEAAPRVRQIAATYLGHGVEHILTG